MTPVVSTCATADLGVAGLAAVRALLEAAFEELEDDDVEHALGGVHVLAHEDGELVGHAAVVLRRLLHDGRSLRTGYVEGVAVRPDLQGRGVGALLMAEVERLVRGGYELGALAATDRALGFYAARGWVPWRGTASVLAPEGVRRTPGEEDALLLLPVSADPRGGDLVCDWREGDVW